jgi:hypothetical protein
VERKERKGRDKGGGGEWGKCLRGKEVIKLLIIIRRGVKTSYTKTKLKAGNRQTRV